MKKIIFVTALFILLTALTTFPLVFEMNTHIPGFFSTDEPSIWHLWWLKFAFRNGINPDFCPMIDAPFGVDLSITGLIFPLSTLLKKAILFFANEAFTYNIEILSSFLLSGIFMYLLVRYVTNNTLAGIFAGVIYAFCPYHFARAWQHIGLSDIQWIPLYIFALFKLKEKSNFRNVFFVALALFLVASFEFHYLYFMSIVTVFLIIFCAVYYGKKSFKFIQSVALSNILVGLALAPIAYTLISTLHLNAGRAIKPGVWSLVRPFQDLFSQSARPLSYILPSSEHPVFGSFTQRFVGTSLYGESFTEHTLFLGFLPMLLAYWGYTGRKRRRNKLSNADKSVDLNSQNFNLRFFFWLLIVSWLFSQPPWWDLFGIKLYMPSFFMYKILPIFRAYCRFGIVTMLAVAALAGFGLKFILEKHKSQNTKAAITVIASLIVLFEFWNYPPFKVIDVSRFPEAYHWLKAQPRDFTIAEYPLDIEGPSETYRFYQTKHAKKMINFFAPGTHPHNIALTIVKLSEPHTAGVLKWLGVKYVFVHRQDYLNSELTEDSEELNKIPLNPGLRLVKYFSAEECPKKDIMCMQKTGPIDVYEVTAKPIQPTVEEK
jgi:hypothetical protein